MNRILRPVELAEFLHVSERLIRKWQAGKIIPFIKVGRTTLFDTDKVMTALQRFERTVCA